MIRTFINLLFIFSIIITVLIFSKVSSNAEGVLLSTLTVTGHIQVKSWKTLRDNRIVKQDLDFSCGAAALATLLNEFYGQNVTEENLLKARFDQPHI